MNPLGGSVDTSFADSVVNFSSLIVEAVVSIPSCCFEVNVGCVDVGVDSCGTTRIINMPITWVKDEMTSMM